MKTIARSLPLLALGTAWFATPTHAAAGTPEARGFSVMTYNVQFRPLIVDFDLCGDDPEPSDICSVGDAGGNAEVYGMSDERRVEAIAERVVAAAPAVVVLQEVFREGAFKDFVEALGIEYPHHAKEPDAYGLFGCDDEVGDDGCEWDSNSSGLMMFSRYAMMPLPGLPSDAHCWQENSEGACEIAAVLFDEAAAADRFAAKTVSYVMLDNTDTGRPLHVFFTHLQSKAGENCVREKQVDQVLEFVAAMTGEDDDVLLLGDLNIKAPLEIPEYSGDPALAIPVGVLANNQPAEEYAERIVGDFAAFGLHDAWVSQSRLDTGFTSDPSENTALRSNGGLAGDLRGRQRIDYALVAPGGAKGAGMCPMHAIVERDRFRTQPGEIDDDQDVLRDLSDHFALTLEIGTEAERCSPALAESLDVGDSSQTPGAIGSPGNVQWYYVKAGGTYSFAPVPAADGDPPLVVTTYAETNLSRPLVAVDGDPSGVSGPKRPVVFDSGEPFFVKVESSDTAWTGAYTLHARPHRGASFDDAIVLDPREVVHSFEMTTQVADPLDRVHFRLQQRALDSGKSQALQFNRLALAPDVLVSVFDEQRQPVADLVGVDGSIEIDPADSPISGGVQDLYFTIDRESCFGSECAEVPFFAWWDTDYRQVDFDELVVLDQATVALLGDDRVVVMMSVDDGDQLEIFADRMDRFASTAINDRRPVGFTDSVKLRVYEVDLGFDDPFSGGSLAVDDVSADEWNIEEFVSTTPDARYELRWRTSP